MIRSLEWNARQTFRHGSFRLIRNSQLAGYHIHLERFAVPFPPDIRPALVTGLTMAGMKALPRRQSSTSHFACFVC